MRRPWAPRFSLLRRSGYQAALLRTSPRHGLHGTPDAIFAISFQRETILTFISARNDIDGAQTGPRFDEGEVEFLDVLAKGASWVTMSAPDRRCRTAGRGLITNVDAGR